MRCAVLKVYLLTALMLAALSSAAHASTIVVSDSTYDYVLFGSSSGVLLGTATFDGTVEPFVYHGLQMTIIETETSLGGGDYQIVIGWLADGDIFPVLGERGLVNIGGFTNPMDTSSSVRLTSAVLAMFSPSGLLASFDFIGSVGFPDPWNGFFIQSGNAAGFSAAGGLGINRIELTLTVSRISEPVPEPATLLLFGTGLAAAGVRRRLRKRG